MVNRVGGRFVSTRLWLREPLSLWWKKDFGRSANRSAAVLLGCEGYVVVGRFIHGCVDYSAGSNHLKSLFFSSA